MPSYFSLCLHVGQLLQKVAGQNWPFYSDSNDLPLHSSIAPAFLAEGTAKEKKRKGGWNSREYLVKGIYMRWLKLPSHWSGGRSGQQ